MINTILDYLKSDDELLAMLNHTKEHPKILTYKPIDKNAYPYIVIDSFTPFTLDILTGQYRCQLRIVTNDDLANEKITRKVTDILHFGTRTGVQNNKETLFHSSLAGNVFSFDEDKEVFEQVLNFSMIFRR